MACYRPTWSRDVYYDYYHALGLQKARFDGLDGEGVTNYYDFFGQPTTTLLAMNGYGRYLSYYHDDAGKLWRLTHPATAPTSIVSTTRWGG